MAIGGDKESMSCIKEFADNIFIIYCHKIHNLFLSGQNMYKNCTST